MGGTQRAKQHVSGSTGTAGRAARGTYRRIQPNPPNWHLDDIARADESRRARTRIEPNRRSSAI